MNRLELAYKKQQEEKMSKSTSSGIGFTGLLTIAFIVLKLMGYIHWSWLWVLSPIWISILVYIGFAIIALIFYAIIRR